MIAFEDVAASLAVATLISLPGAIILRRLRLSILPFAVSAIVLGGFSALINNPSSILFIPQSDGAYYLLWATEIYEGFLGEPMPSQQIWPGKGLWPLMIAIFFLIFGPSLLALHTALVLMSACIIVILQKIVRTVSPKSNTQLVAWIYLTSPATLVYSSLLFREIPFAFGVTLGLLGLSYLHERRLGSGAATLTLSSLLCVGLRPDLGMVITFTFVGLSIALLAYRSWSDRHRWRFIYLVFSAAVVAISFPASLEFVTTGIPLGSDNARSGASVTDVRAYLASSSNTPIDIPCEGPTPWMEAILCGLSSIPSILLGPIPVASSTDSGASLWLFFGATLHFLVVVLVSGFYLIKSKSGLALAALIVSVAIFAAVAVVGTNYGIVFRLRLASEIVLMPFAAVAVQDMIRGRRSGSTL